MKNNNILISYKDKIINKNKYNKININNTDNNDNIDNNSINSDISNNVENIESIDINNTNNTETQPPKIKQQRRLKLERLPVSEIIKAFEDNNGLLTQTAAALGVTRVALSRYINRFPNQDINDAIFHGRQKFLDKCEKKLENHVDSGDPRISLDAVKFTLSTIGKDRGFTTANILDVDMNISAIAPDISKIAEASKKLENIIDIDFAED